MISENKIKDIVELLISSDILISSNIVEKLKIIENFEDMLKIIIDDTLDEEGIENIKEKLKNIYFDEIEFNKKLCIENKNNYNNLEKKNILNNKIDNQVEKKLEDEKTEKVFYEEDKINKTSIIFDKKTKKTISCVKILNDYEEPYKKRDISDFVQYFKNRYKKIENLLLQRSEMINLLSINKIISKKEKESVSFIGLVYDKQTTKNGHIILEVEDLTGRIKVICKKQDNNIEFFKEIEDIVLDEVIGIIGLNMPSDNKSQNNVIFLTDLIFPDIPNTKELKKANEEVYAIFLSDIHIGSTYFMENEFLKFISWLRGETGNPEHKRVASLIRYIFISGDLVDGIGIYPGQEKELTIKDIYKQYDECTRYLKMIPSYIRIIVCGGNHDAIRLSEPQPKLYEDFAKSLYSISNLNIVTNPGYVNIHSSENFSGFDVLLYHGYSFDYYIQDVASIKENGKYHRPDLVMKFLLRRRHLAPSHGSTLYIPDINDDPLVISKVPDFFITGHIHYSNVANYRNVTMICGSCWQKTTPFQEKLGHTPEPCRVPVVNLQTRKVKMFKFGDV
jgi:DNA polymerase II small subunit